MANDSRGSIWRRWDLHFHTPSSFEYNNKGVTNQQIVDVLIAQRIEVVAVTDHHTIDVDRIKQLQNLAGDKLTVLPGIELRSDQGGDPIHYICIFPENCDLNHVWTTLQGRLGLTPKSIQEKGGDQKIYIPIENGAKVTRELDGVVSIHAGAKSNSIEAIRNKEQFQQRIKYDITSKWVDLMEIGQLKDIDIHLNTIFPATGLDKPLIICSDNHDALQYTVKAPLWFRADPTFRGLLMILREPRDRVFIGERPPEIVRVLQNPTKYVRDISFARGSGAPPNEQWFTGSIPLNSGLVAIIGNKGSGKSALADTLGLLGATKKSDSFSFLSKERFRHPASGLAHHFTATIEWESNETFTRRLDESVKPEELERLKYLPQDHVEKVCNEIVGTGEEGFERELKSVIFSHVPEAQRLGHSTLDDLVRFQAGEKQKRIDSLLRQLRETSRLRAVLEAQADPAVKRELEEKIKRRQVELDALDKTKPEPKPDPATAEGTVTPDEATLAGLRETETRKKVLDDGIAKAIETLRGAERRRAVSLRLLEKLANFQKDFNVFKDSLKDDAKELGLVVDDLVSLSIRMSGAERIRDEAVSLIASTNQQLDSDEPPGLRSQLTVVERQITELQSKLDAPNRAYQAYLKELTAWQQKRQKVQGTEKDAESLVGLTAALSDLDQLPTKIESHRDEQTRIALEIHTEKLSQVAVYRNLYGPVQHFVDSQDGLAKDRLKLEFRAELANEDFAERLLSHLAQNRKGSFMGIDEGRAKTESLVEAAKWDEPNSVRTFLQNVDTALHRDEREAGYPVVQLKEQLPKGTKPEEVFNLLYGLEYLRPRYVLRWEGKDLSMLSPGERGTLLLVFYLLIDQDSIPLIIDQPEGNLDNHTVAKVLVDCIKEARKRRQVFIVTHNPNLAVVCDADQVIHASLDKASNNAVTYATGALENPAMSGYVTDVLEGTRWAFGVRDKKYKVAE